MLLHKKFDFLKFEKKCIQYSDNLELHFSMRALVTTQPEKSRETPIFAIYKLHNE